MNKSILFAIIIFTLPLDLLSQSNWFWLDPLPTGATLNSVDFVDINTGYTCGKAGVITKTTNSGINWTLLGPVTVYELRAIKCLNANTCITTGANGSIFKTTNGGFNWISIPSGVSSLLMDINFPSDQIGFISGGNGTLLKSTNGGDNWIFVSLGVKFNFIFSIIYKPTKGSNWKH